MSNGSPHARDSSTSKGLPSRMVRRLGMGTTLLLALLAVFFSGTRQEQQPYHPSTSDNHEDRSTLFLGGSCPERCGRFMMIFPKYYIHKKQDNGSCQTDCVVFVRRSLRNGFDCGQTCPDDAADSAFAPSPAPNTPEPTLTPSQRPSEVPSEQPSMKPSPVTPEPTLTPSQRPSEIPSEQPSVKPSELPSEQPSMKPSSAPNTPEPTLTPSQRPSELPSEQPSMKPSELPSEQPSMKPSSAPNTPEPTLTPSQRPSELPSEQPSVKPSELPSEQPSMKPSSAPNTPEPTLTPSQRPSELPSEQPSMKPSVEKHDEILISCGELDSTGNTSDGNKVWMLDRYYADTNSTAEETGRFIRRTDDDAMYKTYREGEYIRYDIPVPPGDFLVTLHFSENDDDIFVRANRFFDILIESNLVKQNFNPVFEIGLDRRAYELTNVITQVLDGILTIELVASSGLAMINAIEVEFNAPHLAHAVPGGPYAVVDVDGNNEQAVQVNGELSHTHAPGSELVQWIWTWQANVIGQGETATLILPVGEHTVYLKVVDSAGNDSDEFFHVSVLPQGFPTLDTLSPDSGDSTGGVHVTLTGNGYNFPAENITVQMGSKSLTGDDITVVNENTILVKSSPLFQIAAPQEVKVITPIGTSNIRFFTAVSEVPIEFDFGVVSSIAGQPGCLTFGHDGKLYVGTLTGSVYKFTLDENYQVLESVISNKVAGSVPQFSNRVILGIAFDPFDPTPENPSVYVSHSTVFHNSSESFLGNSVNARVSKLSGANLDVMEDIVTGLPVSDHDHAVNGIMFDDQGDLYIQVGGNTNAGIPGPLTQAGIQEENILSAATIRARLGSDPNFNGTIEYDVDGQLVPTSSFDIFATGQRNSYDLVLHSNGNIYATDNGPNKGYGAYSTSCSTSKRETTVPDRLNLLVEGGFYGHANRARGECVWRGGQSDAGDDTYTAPLAWLYSSTDGIIEFESDHFRGQLRGNLIASQFTGSLFRLVLDESGQSVVHGPSVMHPEGGLDLTQGPDGTLFVVQYDSERIIRLKPKENSTDSLSVKSVFPRRGDESGLSKLTVFGENFLATSSVTVGGSPCDVTFTSSSKIECTLPAGFGKADVVVSNGGETAIFLKAYRYIRKPKWEVLVTTKSPLARSSNCFVMAPNGKAYVIGGRAGKATKSFDPATNTWSSKLARAPIPLHHIQCVVAAGFIWVVSAWTGGFPNEQNVAPIYIYDYENDTWSNRTGLPEERRRGAAATVYVERNGLREIYVSHGNDGGHGAHSNTTGWLDKYNIDTDTWTTDLPDAPNPRDHAGGALIGHLLCVAGGRDGGQENFFESVVLPTDCYNLDTGAWEVKAPILVGRAGSAYGTSCDGKLIVAGGEGFGQAFSNVDSFDGEKWEPMDDLNVARHGTGLAVDCSCNQIFITAGSQQQGEDLTTVTERFRPVGSACSP